MTATSAPSHPEAVKAPAISLPPECTAGEAFATVLERCLVHLRANEAAYRATHDPEALHQLRVAVRRFRSALKVFAPLLRTDPQARALAGELKRLGTPFGEARDLDVLAETSDAHAEALRARRLVATEAVDDVLASREWAVLLELLARWVESGRWRTEPRGAQPARDLAAGRLDALRRQVRRDGRRLAKLSEPHRHEVRKEAKTLRYGYHFLGSLFPERRSRYDAHVAAATELQERLGLLNDRVAAERIWQSVGVRPFGDPERQESVDQENLRTAVKARKRLVRLKPFWR